MFINHTPFPGIAFDNFDVQRMPCTTTILRGRFRFHTTATQDLWILRPDPEQGELEAEDRHYGNDLSQPVQRESDYAPYKPATDLILNGSTYSPDKQPRAHWHCGIKVENEQTTLLDKQLQVTGRRDWVKTPKGWQLEEAQPATAVLLHPGNAWGGRRPNTTDATDDSQRYLPNPHGKGWLHPDDHPERVPAPQILTPGATLTRPGEEQTPAHFSWIPRCAPDRARLTGTTDAHWQENDAPFLPRDFDDAFYQGAAPDQQIRPWLQGNEIITLTHLLPGVARQRIALPGYRPLFRYGFDDREDVLGELQLDTVFLALDDPDPKQWRVDLTWRARTPAARGASRTEALLIVPDDHKAQPSPDKETPAQENRHG